MTRTLIIDPAARRCGVAVYEGTTLVQAFTATGPHGDAVVRRALQRVGHVGALVAEDPQTYGNDHRAHANLEPLRAMIARFETCTKLRAKKIRPHHWKGNVPKNVCAVRCALALTPGETECVEDNGDDTWDAIGIGLFHIGRLRRGMR